MAEAAVIGLNYIVKLKPRNSVILSQIQCFRSCNKSSVSPNFQFFVLKNYISAFYVGADDFNKFCVDYLCVKITVNGNIYVNSADCFRFP